MKKEDTIQHLFNLAPIMGNGSLSFSLTFQIITSYLQLTVTHFLINHNYVPIIPASLVTPH